MGDDTKIQWAHHTFNPWIGCTEVSPGCEHCYARTYAQRYGKATWGAGEARFLTSEANWRKPLSWDRKAAASGERHRVFCASLADVFDVEVPKEWLRRLLALVEATPNLDWLLLTKRPAIARRIWTFPANVWLGTTVEDRAHAWRIESIRDVPVTVRFLSVEPLLEDLGDVDLTGIHWVIVGGESGPGARPFDLAWARALRERCRDAGSAYFCKQLGSAPRISTPATLDDDERFYPVKGLRDRKGGDPGEWPADLRVREFPR